MRHQTCQVKKKDQTRCHVQKYPRDNEFVLHHPAPCAIRLIVPHIPVTCRIQKWKADITDKVGTTRWAVLPKVAENPQSP